MVGAAIFLAAFVIASIALALFIIYVFASVG